MNEIDLTKILKNCPKGTKLYSTVYGEVEFVGVNVNGSTEYPIEVIRSNHCSDSFTMDGRLYDDYNGECTLFPNREQRDWSKFTAPWYKNVSSQTNKRTWLYLVSDVLTWKNGIGQYLDDPRVQELAKRLCSKYAQKLYNPSVISNSLNTEKNEQKV